MLGIASKPSGATAYRLRSTGPCITNCGGFWIEKGSAGLTLKMQRCVLVAIEGASRERLASVARWTVAEVVDVSSSGVRAGLEKVRRLADRGEIDAAAFDTLQWPGLGVVATLRELNVLLGLQIELVAIRERISMGGDHGRLISWILNRLDTEHRQKIRGSLARVRAEGRPLGRPRVNIPVETVLRMRSDGASLRHIAGAVGLGVSTVQRFLASNRELVRRGQ